MSGCEGVLVKRCVPHGVRVGEGASGRITHFVVYCLWERGFEWLELHA